MKDRPATASTRLPLFDNARALLILLVAAGHGLEPLLPSSASANGAYDAIYLFHIPAFAFLSGHLSPSALNAKVFRQLSETLLAPLVIFQLLYVAFDAVVLKNGFTAVYLSRPYWILWFLLSLIFWRLLLPLLVRTRAPFTVSVLLSVAIGLLPLDGYVFSLSRTFVFLPCFVAGYVTSREALTTNRFRWLGLVPFAALFAFAFAVAVGTLHPLDTRLLYGSYGYAALGSSRAVGALTRLAVLAIALILTRSFFSLVPRGASVLTRYGAVSLAPFLLHGFFIKYAEHEGAFRFLNAAVAATLAVIVALLLGAPPVVRVTRPLWSPFSRRSS